MKLLTLNSAKEDYCVAKVLIIAALSGVQVDIVSCGENELCSIPPVTESKSMALQATDGTYVTKHLEIMKFISKVSSNLLYGKGGDELSVIEKWLNFCFTKIEVPLQSILAVVNNNNGSSEFQLSFLDGNKVLEKAKFEIVNAFNELERHLSSNTFIASERITAADVSLYSVCGAIVNLSILKLTHFPSLHRWYMTIDNNPRVIDVAKNVNSAIPDKFKRIRYVMKELLAEHKTALGKEVTVQGWVRTSRSAEKGQILFVELNDGSTVKSIQLVLNTQTIGFESICNSGGVGASLTAIGAVVASPAKGQNIEIHVREAVLLGAVYGGDNGEISGKNYPMSKKAHSLEYLREIAHLRIRSKFFSSAMRVRNAMAYATHKFFYERKFVYVHTPLITGADCEGAGEQFAVTTLLPDHAKLTDIPKDTKGNVDFSKDFFGRRTCLTVSGQLNVETHACALSDVYTFGPTFRAEESHTSRHLAEFWMIEPEICFANLSDDMALAEDYVRFCTKYALENCADDLAYFEDEYPNGEKGLRSRLSNVVENEFARITYTEAVALLQKEIALGNALFERYPNWGDDLGSEHERYITEKIYKKPTIVINYPRGIKAFYMKLNDDNITVAAMDILVPKIGELIGGSQREDRLDVLEARCVESGMKPSDIWWYADLRRYGTVPHAGFGLGFERLIMFITGLENIRDVIPFPRVPKNAEF